LIANRDEFLLSKLNLNLMKTEIELLRNELLESLSRLDDLENDLEKLTRSLQMITSVSERMNALFDGRSLSDISEEIYFFKQVKPEILAHRIEMVMKYNLSANIPIGTKEVKIKFYEDELQARHSFFTLNAFHYQYYKNKLTDLDNVYFLRKAAPLTIPVSDFSDMDAQVSSPMTYLFARFIAYERIQYYLLERIADLRIAFTGPNSDHSTNNTEIKWTGDTINIVELAYGLWLTGQLNNGNASLNQIVKWLENNLQVNIGIIQRRFTEIERRKRLSATKFIDHMRDSILLKIENSNA
jgi:hypothetical protein